TERFYRWLRCEGSSCATIAGAESSTYRLNAEDVGFQIEVMEVAKNGGGWNAADSEPTAPVTKPSPRITGVAPVKGPTAGGTTVTITGENLGEATTVEFGFVQATKVTVISATEITAVAPPGAGTVDVSVTTPVGKSEVTELDRFTYVPP